MHSVPIDDQQKKKGGGVWAQRSATMESHFRRAANTNRLDGFVSVSYFFVPAQKLLNSLQQALPTSSGHTVAIDELVCTTVWRGPLRPSLSTRHWSVPAASISIPPPVCLDCGRAWPGGWRKVRSYKGSSCPRLQRGAESSSQGRALHNRRGSQEGIFFSLTMLLSRWPVTP